MSAPDRQAGSDAQDAGRPCLDLSFPSSAFSVREALADVIAALAPLKLCPEEADTVQLVLAEALNNIVEHAYGTYGAQGPIGISACHGADGLHLRIRDQGKEMPAGKAPPGLLPGAGGNRADLAEGGFGWFIIRDLARDVRYHRVGGENQLDLRLAVALSHPR